MCLISFIFAPQADIQLKLIANRDEFYARPSAPLHHWPDTQIIAGQDLVAGGTWLGLSANGRMAALTNHRNPALIDPLRPSRGHLVSQFLNGNISSLAYLTALKAQALTYNPFNLLCFDGTDLIGFESRHQRIKPFSAGVYSVSNADFDSPWPKSLKLQKGLSQIWCDHNWPCDDPHLQEQLFLQLQCTQIAPDALLPQTGIDITRERALSAAFIDTPDYGTRAGSLLAISKERSMMIERSYQNQQLLTEQTIVTPFS